MYLENKKYNSKDIIFLSAMLLVFSVMKVFRGMNTAESAQGGFWNYISLAYYLVFFILLFSKKKLVLNGITIWLFVYSAISLFSAVLFFDSLSIKSIYNLLMIPYPTIVLYCFYYVDKKSKFADTLLVCSFFVCLLVNTYTIIRFRFFYHSRALASDIYFSLCLLPFVLLCSKDKKIKIIAIVSEFFITFLSGKRAGFLALSIALILYYFIVVVIERNQSNKKIIMLILAFVLLFLLYKGSVWIDNKFGMGLFNRIGNLSEDQGSGRLDIYKAVYESYRKSNFFHRLLGHGIYSSVDVVTYMSHNDFLEALYDYGFFSSICLIMFYLSIIVKSFRMIAKKSQYAPVMVLSIVIGLFLSLFSFFMTNYTYVTCMVAFWGYCIGVENEYETI